ncbi:hypothetical protein MKK84_21110 [Methylobacterium sp. E-065]|uniref:hypothetical protein n=1 Tax=Methylobacterium sp. E-065 TaxID=2836583 RepID=UPI001FB9C9C7|nr:hypothetical protein [Methylobacterium sp. E-065]MCJ2019904.1 hypothetical protein [Methylobacterium sp. E-065]
MRRTGIHFGGERSKGGERRGLVGSREGDAHAVVVEVERHRGGAAARASQTGTGGSARPASIAARPAWMGCGGGGPASRRAAAKAVSRAANSVS